MAPVLRVAACHVSPIYLNAKDTTAKCISLIHEAASNGADLVVFPESYIPAFPFWSTVMSVAETHKYFVRMAEESVYVDGPEIIAIRNAAKEKNILVSVGISEKARYSTATMFNANLIIGSDGEILVHHRKIMPTFYEKLTWAPGDGHGLKVVEIDVPAKKESNTGLAKLGMLICGENTNPLARYTMIAQGEQIHLSTWPAKASKRLLFAPEGESSNTAESNGEQQSNGIKSEKPVAKHGRYDNLAVNRTRAAAHCFEGKSFGVMCAGFMSDSMIEALVLLAPESAKAGVRGTMTYASQAETMFLDPTGTPMPGYVVDKSGQRQEKESLRLEEGILYAELDMADTVEGKQFQDIVGSYQRFDIFDLKVNTSRREPVTFVTDSR